jgi:NADH-quinone oxidoreductase subunit N
MILGNTVALWQKDIKRLLAYSSIAHAGYLLVGILGLTQGGIHAVFVYLAVYAFMNLGAFGVVMFLAKDGKSLHRFPISAVLEKSTLWPVLL